MDPVKKRKIRLIVTLGIALLLATTLVYTSFSSSTVAKTPSQLLAAQTSGKKYDLSGKVVAGSIVTRGEQLTFKVRDRTGTTAIPVVYRGTVPDPFREGREIVVTGHVVGGKLIAERDSLITKCPSKFSNSKQ